MERPLLWNQSLLPISTTTMCGWRCYSFVHDGARHRLMYGWACKDKKLRKDLLASPGFRSGNVAPSMRSFSQGPIDPAVCQGIMRETRNTRPQHSPATLQMGSLWLHTMTAWTRLARLDDDARGSPGCERIGFVSTILSLWWANKLTWHNNNDRKSRRL
jgi:hypothetical protein